MITARHLILGCLAAAALVSAHAQTADGPASNKQDNGNGRCLLNSDHNRIQHVVYIQFDNVHFRRDTANVPSDLEQKSPVRPRVARADRTIFSAATRGR
jgi:hypothetical protein